MAAPRVERGRLDFDGQFWGLSNRWSASLLTAPFVGAALFGLVALLPGLYNALVREDSVLESLQFIAYAAATALAAAAGWRLWRTGRRGLGVLFFLFACCCLFAAGEEISWGQRVLGFGTPEQLAAVNGQEEMNVHDVVEVQGKFNLGLAVASLYGLAAPWLVRRPVLAVPPIALGGAFFATVAYISARTAFFPHPGHELAKFSEWPETCFAFALAVFALLAWRRVDAGK
jgi:hypothetical protein